MQDLRDKVEYRNVVSREETVVCGDQVSVLIALPSGLLAE
jgi:hypothetical protein